jgi:signal peptidase I
MAKVDGLLKFNAVFSSLVLAGSGHLYYGAIGRGLVFTSGWLAILAVPKLVSYPVTIIALIVLGIVAAVDVLRQPLARPTLGSGDWWIRVAIAVPVGLLLFLILRHWYVESFLVPQGAMAPTLQSMDHTFVYKSGWKPRRGDVVVFIFPKDAQYDFVMRVVALGGDHVSIRDGQLIVNGHAEPAGTKKDFPAEGGDFIVPADHAFVLGDNRDNSYDSRDFGPVPIKNVKGRAIVVWKRGGAFTWTRIQ